MVRYKWVRWVVIMGLFAFVASGCGISGKDDATQPIDPPPGSADGIEDTAAQAGGEDAGQQAQSQQQVTLYFKDAKGYVAPVTMAIEKTEGIARKSLEYMVEDGPYQQMVPQGFTALLPKGTEIKGMDIVKDKKLAIVDFSKEFLNYNPQDERKILEAVTWTLTGFPSIQQVQLWVEGKALQEMPVDGTPLDEPLTRAALGINIEQAEGVDLSEAVPVTLYFLNQTEDLQTYYVPVTRMIARTDNIAKASVEQLIKGPKGTKLSSVIASDAEVIDVKQADGIVTVNFSDKLLGEDHKAPAESLQSVVLSLTENTGAAKVQIMVNGDAKISGTDNANYSKPVARPAHLNPFKM